MRKKITMRKWTWPSRNKFIGEPAYLTLPVSPGVVPLNPSPDTYMI